MLHHGPAVLESMCWKAVAPAMSYRNSHTSWNHVLSVRGCLGVGERILRSCLVDAGMVPLEAQHIRQFADINISTAILVELFEGGLPSCLYGEVFGLRASGTSLPSFPVHIHFFHHCPILPASLKDRTCPDLKTTATSKSWVQQTLQRPRAGTGRVQMRELLRCLWHYGHVRLKDLKTAFPP